jgi:alpha-galactosidase
MEKDKAEKIKATGVYYRLMIEHARRVLADIKRVAPEYDPRQGYELAGFVWFQGFNDLVSTWTYDKGSQPGGYDMYGQLLAQFIRDARKDLAAPRMPFVIGVMGINGSKARPNELYFRQAQAAPASLPEFQGNVVAAPTSPYWDDDLELLRERLEALWPKMDARAAEALKKNPNLTGAEVEAAKTQVVAENFTPEEQKRLKAASNGGYHYLGAAKIMAPIGKAFAEAMAGMVKK